MSKTKQPKHKPGIHLFKSDEAVNNRKTGRFSHYKTEWYWHIVSRNGRIIARSSETYTRKSGAVKSIKTVAKVFWQGSTFYYNHSKPNSPRQSYL